MRFGIEQAREESMTFVQMKSMTVTAEQTTAAAYAGACMMT